jgi:adenosine kinase
MLLISGSIAHDNIMTYDGIFADHILTDQLPTLSMGFGISSLEKYHGGTGHNIAYALGLL